MHIFTIFIITYQVITGNYSDFASSYPFCLIITYQVITGNYSFVRLIIARIKIITYQVITGNYSMEKDEFIKFLL